MPRKSRYTGPVIVSKSGYPRVSRRGEIIYSRNPDSYIKWFALLKAEMDLILFSLTSTT